MEAKNKQTNKKKKQRQKTPVQPHKPTESNGQLQNTSPDNGRLCCPQNTDRGR